MKPVVNKINLGFGLDMAPTHGALSLVKFDDDGNPLSVRTLAHFDKTHIGERFSKSHQTADLMADALLRARWLEEKVSHYSLPIVYVDYTVLGTAFMPSGKIYGSKWSFVMGAFFANCSNMNIGLFPVPPAKIRKHFGLNARTPKAGVYLEFAKQYPEIYRNLKEVAAKKTIKQDYYDATLLAIVGGA